MLLFVAAPDTVIPVTVVPVEDKDPIVLLLMLIVVEVLEQVIPNTDPPVPEDVRPVTTFEETVTGLVLPNVEPKLIPVIAPCPVIEEIVSFDNVLAVPPPQ